MSTFLVVCHTARSTSLAATTRLVTRFLAAGHQISVPAEHMPALGEYDPAIAGLVQPWHAPGPNDIHAAESVQLAIALGGDGTLLRAAELVHPWGIPVLGINLGHVGFLTEAEGESLDDALEAILSGRYEVEDRLCVEASVERAGKEVYRSWALNEASVEKGGPQRMLEVELEVDGRPLSKFGCDGVIVATPTGSTAYAFSSGGPVMWPNVAALLLVPVSAHALFARPLIVGPQVEISVAIAPYSTQTGVLSLDGRRMFTLDRGDRITARASATPVRLVRLGASSFGDRLVRKFDLPIAGWRGTEERS